jgi:nitrate reductase gamma subunit
MEGDLLTLAILIFVLAAMLLFLILSAAKAWRYSRYPVHSRLDLYPVPKEGGERASYGGSYFEEAEWWKKPRVISKGNETRDILLEMLFIRKLFLHQRSLWWASMLFHWGIYALFAWTILLLLAVLLPVDVLVMLALVVGCIGFLLATLGALLLLMRRIFDGKLRVYTTPQEFFNLILILAVLLTGIISWAAITTPFVVANELFSAGWQADTASMALHPLVAVHLILLGIMLIYIPVSKMSHYVGKFFAFHKVLWDNDPNKQGSEVNARLKRSQAEPPKNTWSAPHIETSPKNSNDPLEQ